MSDKDKVKSPSPSKNIPKDGQVIMAIMKEMGIKEYDPKTIVQLTDFVHRYATTVLDEARTFANNCKKKVIDVEDIRLAIHLSSENIFTTPPSREVTLDCAYKKNSIPLPPVKPSTGIRLPPERQCLTACNYVLKTNSPKKQNRGFNAASTSGIKIVTKPGVSYAKRSKVMQAPLQTPIPSTSKGVGARQQKDPFRPKIHIQQNIQIAPSLINDLSTPMEIDDIDNFMPRGDDEDITFIPSM